MDSPAPGPSNSSRTSDPDLYTSQGSLLTDVSALGSEDLLGIRFRVLHSCTWAIHGGARELGTIRHTSVRLDRVIDTATTLMSDHGLASYDAAHAASAIAAGAKAIATTDTGQAMPSPRLRSTITSCRSRTAFPRRSPPLQS